METKITKQDIILGQTVISFPESVPCHHIEKFNLLLKEMLDGKKDFIIVSGKIELFNVKR